MKNRFNSKKKNHMAGAAARMLAAAIAVTAALPGLSALAATGTINTASVNVRASASTSAAVVGSVTTGETYEVGETAQDDTGATWYQITLADGQTGYVRSDFIDVTEDDTSSGTESTESQESTETGTTTTQADTTSTDTGDYQVLLSPDENGNETYYLYDNAASKRMKISDIENLSNQVTDLQAQVASAGNRYRTILIVLAVLLVAAVAAAIVMFVRLRDALTNGRTERDLTSERRQERKGNPDADGLTSLKRGQKEAKRREQDARNNAYPSGRREGTRQPEPEMTRQSARQGQQVQGQAGRTQQGPTMQGQQVRRPVQQGQQAAGQQVRRPVQQGQQMQGQSQQVRRPVQQSQQMQGQGQQVRRPVQQGQQMQGQNQQVRRPVQQPRQQDNYGTDDDFDYDFISLDDDRK